MLRKFSNPVMPWIMNKAQATKLQKIISVRNFMYSVPFFFFAFLWNSNKDKISICRNKEMTSYTMTMACTFKSLIPLDICHKSLHLIRTTKIDGIKEKRHCFSLSENKMNKGILVHYSTYQPPYLYHQLIQPPQALSTRCLMCLGEKEFHKHKFD